MWRDRVLPTGDVLPPHPPPKNTTLLGVAEKEDCAYRSLQGRSGALGYLHAKVALRSTDSLPRGHRGVRGSLVRSPASLARPTSIAVENCNCPPPPKKKEIYLKTKATGVEGTSVGVLQRKVMEGTEEKGRVPRPKKSKGRLPGMPLPGNNRPAPTGPLAPASERGRQECSHPPPPAVWKWLRSVCWPLAPAAAGPGRVIEVMGP